MRSLSLACFLCAVIVPESSAVTLWCGGNRSGPFHCPVQSPENGHYYAQVISIDTGGRPINWDNARSEAETLTYDGLTGYLATITSAVETDFLQQRLPNGGPKWIGASDAASEGEWRWMTGPETGELFWQGAQDGTAVSYADWNSGEPNNSFLRGEDHAAFGEGQGHRWNDLPNDGIDRTWVNGYIVEFSVPEPSTYALAIIGLIGFAGVIRQRKRR
ncbi:MAG: lectin-like protein [Planctomycetia bacterium]|nr:lectin-like protein [Planctomycetia bacterium]